MRSFRGGSPCTTSRQRADARPPAWPPAWLPSRSAARSHLLVQSPPQLAKLGALHGDHLADEPTDEEDAAEDEARLDQCPDGADSLPGDEERRQRAEARQRA